MSVLKAVPDFIQAYVRPDIASLLTYLSKTAFTGLPEIILFVATLKTLDQIRLVRTLEKGSIARKMAVTWSYLFGIPSAIFITFSLVNIGLSLASSTYSMPDNVVVARGLTCFIYALLCFIYDSRGHDCLANEVRERDSQIATLESRLVEKDRVNEQALADQERQFEIALQVKDRELFAIKEESFLQLEAKQNEIEVFLLELSSVKSEKLRLAEKASSLVSDKLSYYPKLTAFLEKEGCKTIDIDTIVSVTGIAKRRINKAIADKSLSLQSRNKEVLVSSLLKWLQDIPAPTVEIEQSFSTNGNGHSQDTEKLDIASMPLLLSTIEG